MKKGEEIKPFIVERMHETMFKGVWADNKGNYMSVIISSKKKYEAVSWTGDVETQVLTPVKNAMLPIAGYIASKVLDVINNVKSRVKLVEKLVVIVSAVMKTLNDNTLDSKTQMIEKKINDLPHYVY